jgi:hypothetical protein
MWKKAVSVLPLIACMGLAGAATSRPHPDKPASFRSSLKHRVDPSALIHSYAGPERATLSRLIHEHLEGKSTHQGRLVVRSFLRLRALAAPGESFGIAPSDIEAAIKDWQPASVKKLAQTLAFAADYTLRQQKGGKRVTNDEALTQAKKAMGIKDDSKGCRI